MKKKQRTMKQSEVDKFVNTAFCMLHKLSSSILLILLCLGIFGMTLSQSATGQTQDEDQVTEPNYIQIDDMRFRTGELSILSGFYGPIWTDGKVYYQFDSDVAATDQQRWTDAANEWAASANL